jgi:hypothetical protein
LSLEPAVNPYQAENREKLSLPYLNCLAITIRFAGNKRISGLKRPSPFLAHLDTEKTWFKIIYSINFSVKNAPCKLAHQHCPSPGRRT